MRACVCVCVCVCVCLSVCLCVNQDKKKGESDLHHISLVHAESLPIESKAVAVFRTSLTTT